MLTAGAIKARAVQLGFDLCGIAPAAPLPELGRLRGWLDEGYAGDMAYLARSASRRMDPAEVLPGARTVIVTGTIYNVERPYSVERSDVTRAVVSRYAWGEDYHRVIGGRLATLLAWMRAESAGPFEAHACVDTGPVQEKIFANYAGIGWIGKNACVINPGVGSWFFLAVILCSLDLEIDPPALDQCGTCTLCLEACPTGALVGPRRLDATKCIAYLTIEAKGPIPRDLRPQVGQRIFGCDVCQDVCPFNATAARSAAPEWQPRPGLEHPALSGLWRLDDAELSALVAGTPLTRPKLAGLRRNLAVALGNCGDPGGDMASACEGERGDAQPAPSRYHPLVREHVAWARSEDRRRGIT